MEIAFRILEALVPGQFVSGSALAGHVGVARSTVCKAVGYLKTLGVAIDSLHGKGYRLCAPIEFLNAKKIYKGILPHWQSHLETLDVVHTLSSTNDYFKPFQCPRDAKARVCLAEGQLKGRGRHQRQWQSWYGANLYFSMQWGFDAPISALSDFSLRAGIATLKAIEQVAPVPKDVAIKWPNDIYFQGAKLGGILVESHASMHTLHRTELVVGIGLNVCKSPAEACGQYRCTHLNDVYGQPISRNQLASALIQNLISMCLDMDAHVQFDLRAAFAPYDALKGKEVVIKRGVNHTKGTVLGVTQKGELLIESQKRKLAFRCGEISLGVLE